MTETPAIQTCSNCGSEEVLLDAWVDGNNITDVVSVFDQAYCSVCDGETTLEQKPHDTLQKTRCFYVITWLANTPVGMEFAREHTIAHVDPECDVYRRQLELAQHSPSEFSLDTVTTHYIWDNYDVDSLEYCKCELSSPKS